MEGFEIKIENDRHVVYENGICINDNLATQKLAEEYVEQVKKENHELEVGQVAADNAIDFIMTQLQCEDDKAWVILADIVDANT